MGQGKQLLLGVLSFGCLFLSGPEAMSAPGKAVSGNDALLSANKLAVNRKYSEAIEKYKEAITLNPKNPDCYHMYGRTLALMGLAYEAIAQYRLAYELKPSSAELCNDIGVALVVNDNITHGANFLKRATMLNTRYVSAYNNLGVALQKLGDYRQAEEAFLSSLKLQPTNPVIQKRHQLLKEKLSSTRHFEFNRDVSLDEVLAEALDPVQQPVPKREESWEHVVIPVVKSSAINHPPVSIGEPPAFGPLSTGGAMNPQGISTNLPAIENGNPSLSGMRDIGENEKTSFGVPLEGAKGASQTVPAIESMPSGQGVGSQKKSEETTAGSGSDLSADAR